jgi:hypothetical protein
MEFLSLRKGARVSARAPPSTSGRYLIALFMPAV